MTKQKIVIRVSMDHQKSRSKALKICVSITGVESATVKGDQVEVIGDGVDAVELTRRLRKSMSHAEIVSVGEIKKEENKNISGMQEVWMQPDNNGYRSCNYPAPAPAQDTDPGCTIL